MDEKLKDVTNLNLQEVKERINYHTKRIEYWNNVYKAQEIVFEEEYD